jgi:hypothetical protein
MVCLFAVMIAAFTSFSSLPSLRDLARAQTTSAPASATGRWTGRWTALGPSRLKRAESGAARVGRSVYVVGGLIGPTTTNKVERYDVDQDRWVLVRPMPETLNHPAAVGYRGKLYVLGGYTGGVSNPGVPTEGIADASDAFLRYDPANDRWSRMPRMPVPRSAFAAAVIGHRLYVAGGRSRFPTYVSGVGLLKRLDIFDFQTGRWSRGPDMAIAREHVPGVALNGAMYVLGGRTAIPEGATRTVERYLPGTGKWERVADMRVPHNGFGAVVVGDSIVAFGGEEPSNAAVRLENPYTELYDPRRDRWIPLPMMRTPRGGLAGAAVGRRVLAIEGIDPSPTTSCCRFTNIVEQLIVP